MSFAPVTSQDLRSPAGGHQQDLAGADAYAAFLARKAISDPHTGLALELEDA